MTIENGIRILAGTLVLTGTALGYWVHQTWFILPAFVGFNLIQSALTGLCPAAFFLRKMGLKSCGETTAN